jgi:signal transduction histidine kinase
MTPLRQRHGAALTPLAADGPMREAFPAARGAAAAVPGPDTDLQGAATRVAATCSDPRAVAADAEEVGPLVSAVAGAVQLARRGAPFTLEPRARSILGRRLLELLRSELVRGWGDLAAAPDTARVLDTLQALECVREALEPDWPKDVAAPLAGADGLELLVEVAHDLRSPLTSILFLAETLQRGQSGGVNELQHRQLGLIYSAALALSSLTSDAIELVRNGNELLDEGSSPFSLIALLDSIKDIVQPMAEEKHLSVRVVTQEPDHRLGNPLALGRVLLNLTTNALTFTDHGFVEIRAEPRGPTAVEFSVRDTGRGVNPNALGNLYEPFRRAPGRGGYCFSSTGLGLAICRKLVVGLGAELRMETRPDWGTRFYFEQDLPPAPDA